MSTKPAAAVSNSGEPELLSETASKFNIPPAQMAHTLHDAYQRHLLYDNGVDPAVTNVREHYEAFARSVREILAQRWALTRRT